MLHFIKFTRLFYCDSSIKVRFKLRFAIAFFIVSFFLAQSLIFGGFELAFAADAMVDELSKPHNHLGNQRTVVAKSFEKNHRQDNARPSRIKVRARPHLQAHSRIRTRSHLRLRPSPAGDSGDSHSRATSNPQIVDDALNFVNDPEISPLIEKMIESKLSGAGGGAGGILGALSSAAQTGAGIESVSGRTQGTGKRIERTQTNSQSLQTAQTNVQSLQQSQAQNSIRKIKIEKIANRTPFSRNWAYYPLTITSPTNSQQVTEFQVQIPKNRKQKQKGLMFRTRLADYQGMLFIYRTPQNITMWMENTYIPLDMVFIAPNGSSDSSDSSDSPDGSSDKNRGKIVDIIYNTKPLSRAIISSPHKAIAVLELKAGTARKFNLQIGAMIEWNSSNAINKNE